MPNREFTNINGIYVCDQKARDNMPTKTSQLENDSNFVTDSVVDEKISNAQLGGGEVDLSSYAKIKDLPTKTSQLTNDSGYITNIPGEYITETELNAKGYATTSQIPTVPTNVSAFTNDANYASETFVTNKIAEASLSGGEVDLSGYVTKETGNANQITFADGQTFQAKLDAGTLKGQKGDKGERGLQGEKGDKGADGLTTSISLNGVTYTQENGVITLPNITSGGDTPSVAHIEPEELDMPKVFFNGDKPTDKTSVHATIEYISKTEHFKGYVDIKCQGTSSMAYPKKNYTIKMFSDEARSTKLKKDFKGWGKQSKFCLKANYIDHSHARNVVSAKLWGQVVKSRSDFDTLPEELKTSPNYGAVDGFPIKVYYNGTYEGVYTWNIPKDGWMNNMDDKLDTHCILCGEEYSSGCFREANASLWSDELHDVMPANIVTSFNAFQNFVINSSDDEFKTGLSTYADVNSLIDYYIFQYAICGLDSMGKNQLFFTYDGTKWIASSYDMDSTFGLYWNGQSFVSATYRMQEDYESMGSGRPGNLLYIRLEELFYEEIKARYAELRAGVLSYANIVNKFERFMDIIGKDLYAEDLTIYTAIPSGNTNNIQQIRNYTRDRLTYVDGKIEELGPFIEVPCTAISLDKTELALGLASGGDGSPLNLLDGVGSSIVSRNVQFDEITLPPGIYELTNINGGTFTWLGHIINGGEDIQGGDNTNAISFTIESTSTVVLHAFPNNIATNTADKLALYKKVQTDIALTQAGQGYFTNDGSIVEDANNIYTETISLDSNETYILKYVGAERISLSSFCLMIGGTFSSPSNAVDPGDTITTITGVDTFALSLNIERNPNSLDQLELFMYNYETSNVITTAQLTATVSPTNCTQPVVWSVSPEGVVTVVNGLVTAVTNGEATVTATCGTQSDTCNVTVSGMS